MSNGELYTIGHSNHSIEHFIDLLKRDNISKLIDVRSSPYSKYAFQFNKHPLETALLRIGIDYKYMGNEIGGRPESDRYYDSDGYVLYGELAKSEAFRRGIETLKQEVGHGGVAIMCSEEDPRECYRHLLIARVMSGEGFVVKHIRGDGSIETEEALSAAKQGAKQLSLDGLEVLTGVGGCDKLSE